MTTSSKFLIAIMIISALVLFPFSTAKGAAAVAYITKEFGLDVAARLFARQLLSRLENSIVGKIMTIGEDGRPVFILDWRNFQQRAQYRGEDILRAIIANATTGTDAQVCEYIRSSLTNIFSARSVPGFTPNNYRVDSLYSYALRNKCTLSANFDANAFRNDFNQGGWDAWLKLIQPQNNFYGIFADSIEELSRQRSLEEEAAKNEAVSGEGHTSGKSDCQGEGQNKQCVIMGLILTPGAIFSDAEKATINRELDWLVSADELSETIVNATYSVLNNLENMAVGAAEQAVDAGEPGYDSSVFSQQAQQDEELWQNYMQPPSAP